jgi:hypothetical protein
LGKAEDALKVYITSKTLAVYVSIPNEQIIPWLKQIKEEEKAIEIEMKKVEEFYGPKEQKAAAA